MKASTSVVAALVALAPLASAWSNWLPDIDALVVRQNADASGGATATPTQDATAKESDSGSTKTNTDKETGTTTTGRKQTDLNTAKVPTGSESITPTADIDPNAAAGAAVMVTPGPLDPGLRLYKIGTNVTFGWNYTDVIVPPTAIDVLASCSAAARTWTLTSNMTYETDGGSYTWETQHQATDIQSPLLTEEYTLVIYDADTAVTDTPQAGYLGASSPLKFKLYVPQEPVDFADWKCPTCSAAPPSFDSKALSLAMTMSVATVLSFTWFAAGF